MSGAKVQFGRVPYAMIDQGKVALMKPSALRVYLVIAAHVGADWSAVVGLDRLAKLTGKSRPTILRAISDLEALNVLDVDRGGGRRRVNRYCLAGNGNVLGVTVLGGETVTDSEETVTNGPLNGNDLDLTGTEEKKKQSRNPATGFEPGSEAEIGFRKLIAAKVEPDGGVASCP